MIRRLPARASLITAVLAGFVVACSGGPAATVGPGGTGTTETQPPAPNGATAAPNAGGGPAVDACALLGAADFKEIADLTVTETDSEFLDTVYPDACRWAFEEYMGTIDLGVMAVGGQSFLERTLDLEGGTEVTDIGDRAIRTEITTAFMALTGDTLLDLFAAGAGTSEAVEQELLARAIENLGR